MPTLNITVTRAWTQLAADSDAGFLASSTDVGHIEYTTTATSGAQLPSCRPCRAANTAHRMWRAGAGPCVGAGVAAGCLIGSGCVTRLSMYNQSIFLSPRPGHGDRATCLHLPISSARTPTTRWCWAQTASCLCRPRRQLTHQPRLCRRVQRPDFFLIFLLSQS